MLCVIFVYPYNIIFYSLQMYVSVDLVGVADKIWFLHAFYTFKTLSFLLRLDKDCSFGLVFFEMSGPG